MSFYFQTFRNLVGFCTENLELMTLNIQLVVVSSTYLLNQKDLYGIISNSI